MDIPKPGTWTHANEFTVTSIKYATKPINMILRTTSYANCMNHTLKDITLQSAETYKITTRVQQRRMKISTL